MLNWSKIFLILFVLALSIQPLHTQTTPQPVYIIVHGAWGGGWAFKKVDSLLTAEGNLVYRPTLTGLGEKNHLSSPDIGLNTHIKDVVNVLLYEDLHHVILVGHSYGGMIITGVADSLPDRIDQLIYLDAILPEDQESVVSIMEGNNLNAWKTENGFIIPWWVEKGKNPPKDVLHPLKSFTDKITLKNPERINIASTYVLTVDPGTEPIKDRFYDQAERARRKGWRVLHVSADHNPQWSAPEALVTLLQDVVKR